MPGVFRACGCFDLSAQFVCRVLSGVCGEKKREGERENRVVETIKSNNTMDLVGQILRSYVPTWL